MASAIAVVVLARAFVRFQHNRYRREALAMLARLAPPGAATETLPAAMAEVLRRCALTAFPRERVAALTGPEWFNFLDATGGTRFAAGLGEALEASIYRGEPLAADCIRELGTEIETWVRRHAVPTRTADAETPPAPPASNARKAA
jgi:hypothetical protein